jgi:hypothetical protein
VATLAPPPRKIGGGCNHGSSAHALDFDDFDGVCYRRADFDHHHDSD